ncbi:hypothetical protein [Haladaptatus caseinilyticus]|uniref:hypothetical protein n=1 Tax=Haladaptatus caseinilyticus TaxID=2993314 RepID=UPI00224A585B|nr:hypothetical protein [Haladaptatus caseinilyticus]
MLRTLLGVVQSGFRLLSSAAPAGNNSLDKLNVISLLAQAGNAFRKGQPMKGAILLGAATIAPKHRKLSYLVQGAITIDDLRKRFR